MALSRIDTTNMIEDVPQSKLDNNINFRNILINSDMSIAQRGTSFTGITSGSNYCLDRFTTVAVSAGTWTQTQSTDVPTGQGFAKSAKLDCTTANGSLSANSLLYFQQRVEGQNLQYLKKGTANAESLTASFWVKSNKTGTYIVELFDGDNTRQISKSYTINLANTWEKKTITFAGDTTGAFDNDNALSLYCFFYLSAGTDYTSGTLNTSWNTNTNANRAVGQVNLADSTDNEWYMTGVQLEAGQTASEFEFLPFDINMQRCSRYYTVLKIGATGNSSGSGQSASARETFNFMSPMRSAPSFTTSGLGGVGISTTQIANDITENGGYVSPFSTASGRIYFAGTFAFNSEL
jgi:hypothetical protein